SSLSGSCVSVKVPPPFVLVTVYTKYCLFTKLFIKYSQFILYSTFASLLFVIEKVLVIVSPGVNPVFLIDSLSVNTILISLVERTISFPSPSILQVKYSYYNELSIKTNIVNKAILIILPLIFL